ncbi:MAG: hypothetical protein N3D11_08960, partial [Candidatus Sumerlaeia bacterium]|nr:hypothetical protein [Candidatus Sumerlaeia bacterium]
LRYALARLTASNAQGEEYLTDAIGILAAARDKSGRPKFHVTRYAIPAPSDALTFNTPEELEVVRKYFGRERRP